MQPGHKGTDVSELTFTEHHLCRIHCCLTSFSLSLSQSSGGVLCLIRNFPYPNLSSPHYCDPYTPRLPLCSSAHHSCLIPLCILKVPGARPAEKPITKPGSMSRHTETLSPELIRPVFFLHSSSDCVLLFFSITDLYQSCKPMCADMCYVIICTLCYSAITT